MSKDRILKDPYANTQNPFHIIARIPKIDNNDPDNGYVLGWKSERFRNGSGHGWMGWEALEYGDKFTGENGEKLRPYVPDPPRRMVGPDKVDNLVRRADTILCRLPADWFDQRQEASARRSREMVENLTAPEGTELIQGNSGVTSIGGGRQSDKKASFDTKLTKAQQAELDEKLRDA